jgi:hypothetical protein
MLLLLRVSLLGTVIEEWGWLPLGTAFGRVGNTKGIVSGHEFVLEWVLEVLRGVIVVLTDLQGSGHSFLRGLVRRRFGHGKGSIRLRVSCTGVVSGFSSFLV